MRIALELLRVYTDQLVDAEIRVKFKDAVQGMWVDFNNGCPVRIV